MLRVYCLQQWFDLSDPQAEDMLYDSESMRRFARLELGTDVVPDESTILRFRHLLERASADGGDLCGGQRAAEREAVAAEVGLDRGCDDHRGADLDQEREQGAGSRDEADPQGQRVAFRDEAARGHRPARAGAPCDGHRCGDQRHLAIADAAARRGAGAVRGQGVLEGRRSPSIRSPGRALPDEPARGTGTRP